MAGCGLDDRDSIPGRGKDSSFASGSRPTLGPFGTGGFLSACKSPGV